MELLQLELFINMEYYILLATFGLSLVSYTLGLDLLWWLIIFECTSNVNITICLRAPNAIHRGLTLHDIIGVLKISLSEVYIKRLLQYPYVVMMGSDPFVLIVYGNLMMSSQTRFARFS